MSVPVTEFSQLALAEPILRALEKVGYTTPSPIQAESIPHLLEGKDILGQAQTGTGKTAAFALPTLNQIDASSRNVQVLVLVPTRELAIQVAKAYQDYAEFIRELNILPIYGGQSLSDQMRQLRRGVQVVVGTPGRVMDHLRRKTLDLSNLRSIVLDEADEMLKMGFIDDVQWILDQTPSSRQVALFSATMPPMIRKVANKHLKSPVEVKIKSATTTNAKIEQLYWQVNGVHKFDALTRFLEVENFDAAIIFARTKSATTEVSDGLEQLGFRVAALNGDLNQSQRERVVQQLKNKELDIVIATDVAARGLDVERITHVFNYDVPFDSEAYVHRIGRTGRAGREGRAVLFINNRETRFLRSIERVTGQRVERIELPKAEDVSQKRINDFKTQVKTVAERGKLDFYANVFSEMCGEMEMEPEQLAAAVLCLAQKDKPLKVVDRVVSPHRRSQNEGRRNEGRGDNRQSRGRSEGAGRDRGRQNGDRGRSNAGGDRDARPARARHDKDVDMVRYRIEVGREHGVTPRDIVGAIANEAGMESRYIGHIKLNDQHSLVDLPDGMPKDIFQHLKRVRVRNRVLNIQRDA